MTPAQRLTEETAIERQLEKFARERRFFPGEAEQLRLARDLVRCWREYHEADRLFRRTKDLHHWRVMECRAADAAVLLARGDEQ